MHCDGVVHCNVLLFIASHGELARQTISMCASYIHVKYLETDVV